MLPRLLALAIALSLVALPLVPLRAAASDAPLAAFGAIVVVSEADLDALLESGVLDDYALVSAADLGLDETTLARWMVEGDPAMAAPATLLSPTERPDIAQVATPAGPPIIIVRGHHVPPLPFIRVPLVHPVAVVVVPRPPLLVVPPPPPPPLRPHPDRFVPVPIIPEADSALLLVAGLLVVGGLVAWGRRRAA